MKVDDRPHIYAWASKQASELMVQYSTTDPFHHLVYQIESLLTLYSAKWYWIVLTGH